MNKRNREKFKKVKSHHVDEKQWNYFIEKLTFKQQLRLISHMVFKTRRAVLFLSCCYNGLSVFSAHNVAFGNKMDVVINSLESHGWDMSFGKLA